MKTIVKKAITLVTLTTFLMVIFTNLSNAQSNTNLAVNTTNYNTAIGVRGGETSGITIKHFIGDAAALEGIVGVWHRGLNLTGLYEIHQPAFNVAGLNWYYGAGGHVAITSGYYYDGWYRRGRYHYYDGGEVGLGIDGIVGLEYKIKEIPFAISLDAKPFLEVVSNGAIWGSIDPGLGIKVTF